MIVDHFKVAKMKMMMRKKGIFGRFIGIRRKNLRLPISRLSLDFYMVVSIFIALFKIIARSCELFEDENKLKVNIKIKEGLGTWFTQSLVKLTLLSNKKGKEHIRKVKFLCRNLTTVTVPKLGNIIADVLIKQLL